MIRNQERYTIIVLLVLSFLAKTSIGQETEWFVLNDFSYVMKANDVVIDDEGSSYVFGEFEKEVQFNSLDSNDLSIHAAAHFRDAFFAKYDRTGQLQFINFIAPLGSNSNYVIPGPLLILNDGRVAALFTATSGYRMTIQGVESEERTSKSSKLCIFNTSGTLDKIMDVPLTYCHFLEQNAAGDLYMMGRKSGYASSQDQQHLVLIKSGKTMAQLIELPKKKIIDAEMFNDKIWILSYEFKESKYYSSRGIYHVETVDANTSAASRKVFQKETGFIDQPYCGFVISGGELRLSMIFEALGTRTIEFDGQSIPLERSKNILIVYDQNGNEVHRTKSNGFARYSRVIGTPDGGYLVSTTVPDTLKIDGRDEISTLRTAMWYSELMHIKLDDMLQVQWIENGGPVSTSHGFICVQKIVNDHLYVVARMTGLGVFDFGERDLEWANGLYIRKIRIQ